MKDIEFAAVSANGNDDVPADKSFIQVNIVDGDEKVYLIKDATDRIKNKWLESGNIRFSERYWISVRTDSDGRYQNALYDKYAAGTGAIMTESHEEFQNALRLRHGNKTFQLLVAEGINNRTKTAAT